MIAYVTKKIYITLLFQMNVEFTRVNPTYMWEEGSNSIDVGILEILLHCARLFIRYYSLFHTISYTDKSFY